MAQTVLDINSIKKKIIESKDGYDDYQELINDLAIVNSTLPNTFTNVAQDITDTSYKSALRHDREKLGVNKYFEKINLYGVLIATRQEQKGILSKIFGETQYFVDVPGRNNMLIADPDNVSLLIKLDDKIAKEYEILSFSDNTGKNSLINSIPIGSIVIVKVPYNYPNHLSTNSSDSQIIGIEYRGRSFKPSTNFKKAKTSTGYNAQNGGGGGVIYGSADIPYTWALTKTGKAPENLQATELAAIKRAKGWFDQIKQQNLIQKFAPIVSKISSEFSIAPFYINSIIAIESNFNQSARSRTGAGGLMQLTQIAIKDAVIARGNMAKKYPQAKLENGQPNYELIKTDPELNVWAGTFGFKMWYNKYGGDILRIAGAYNGGDTGVNSGIPTLDWNRIRGESTVYIFRYNAMLNFIKQDLGLGAAS